MEILIFFEIQPIWKIWIFSVEYQKQSDLEFQIFENQDFLFKFIILWSCRVFMIQIETYGSYRSQNFWKAIFIKFIFQNNLWFPYNSNKKFEITFSVFFGFIS